MEYIRYLLGLLRITSPRENIPDDYDYVSDDNDSEKSELQYVLKDNIIYEEDEEEEYIKYYDEKRINTNKYKNKVKNNLKNKRNRGIK